MAGSVRSCCVPKCGVTRADSITLHSFPDPVKEKARFAIWVNAVGSSISSLDYDFIHKNRKICHNHFEEKFLTWTRRLSKAAVPTLNMPGFHVEPVMRDITNIGTAASRNDPGIASTSAGEVYMSVPMESSPGKKPSKCKSEDITPGVKLVHTEEVPVNQTIKSQRKGTPFKDDKEVLAQLLKKVTKKKESYAARLKKALKLSENATFQNILRKFTSLAAIFLTMQFREIGKNKMGRRFTQEEKIMALSLYKQGPRLYRFLSKAFVLPSPLTLSRLIARADLRAGINEKLFKVIKKKAKQLKADDKLCVLLFDEVAIMPHFDYNSRKDAISGFVTNGKTKEKKIADHALVFMIRGILRNYKQPIAYTFCSGSTKKEELAMLLTDIIKKLHSVGLRVLATVCDQGASNVSCIKHLVAETKANYLRVNKELKRDIFEIDGEEVIPLFDPPHLIKGIRNNLLNKNLKCTIDGVTKVAKWEHLVQLHKEDPAYSGVRLLKKLTDDHINPEKCKMKVKFATQIFSQKVASTMGYLAGKNILPKECTETADVLLFFDELFDSVNGSRDNSKKRSGKPLLDALKPGSSHHEVWTKAKKILSTMTFLKGGKESQIPSVKNWLHTINNMEYLRDVLFYKHDIKSVWLRHFNQDPLENFFGAIRSHGCRNINPTPEGFAVAFASLLINNLTGVHSSGSNCEQDSCTTMFQSMKELFKFSKQDNISQDIDLNYMNTDIYVDYSIKKGNPQIFAQLQYVTGYILKKTRKSVFTNCVTCKNCFYNKQQDCDYLRAREYNKSKQYLHYPSDKLMETFSKMQDILMWVLTNHSEADNLRNYVKTILYIEINMNFNSCINHKDKNVEFMYELVCNFFIHNWCKDVNNILKGRRKDNAHSEDIIKNLAISYVNKRKK